MPEPLTPPLVVAPPAAETLARLALRSGARPVVLIDGRSGSGKTTLGEALAPLIPGAQLVGLDDVYPGWEGLGAASRTVETGILRPTGPGYRRWDWERSSPAEWRSLSPSAPLVVEGAGALTPVSASRATLRVWVELPDDVRVSRLRSRSDAASYLDSPWWGVWAEQEERHLAANRPQALADVVVSL